MRHTAQTSILVAACAIAGCGDDDSSPNATTDGSASGETDAPTTSASTETGGSSTSGGEEGTTDAQESSETGDDRVCEGLDCGPNGSCVLGDDGPACLCDDGYVLVEESCVSTESWKLDDGHFIPAKMPMTVVHPRPDEETNAWARNRVAHPQFRYELPIGVQGGAWPFLYELVDGPQGASVGQIYGQADYGVVAWEPEASGTHTFEVRITDQDLQTVTARWTVTVDAGPFVFVDGDGGDDGGTGTIDDPLRTFSGWYHDDVGDDTYAERILVFREAAEPYLMTGDPVEASGNCRLSSATKPIVWLGYPGERPVIDASQSKVFVEAPRADLYVSGLRFEHGRQDVANAQFFWVTGGGDRITFWRNEYFDLGPGQVGNDNTGAVFISDASGENFYILTKENLYEEIDNDGYNGHFVEVYRASYVLYEQELARNSTSASGWFPKGAISHITVRNNTAIDNVSGTALKGSFGGEAGQLPHEHEFGWNNVRVQSGNGFLMSASAFYEGEFYGGFVYRNTFVGGDPWLRFEGSEPYETDGNVVITGDPSRFGEGISIHPAAEDLIGSPGDGLVDDDNRLTGQARADYLGVRGHEVD
jgi:hypothetical protein